MAQATSALTLTEAADLLGVHYMTAYRYVRTGRLPAWKVGSSWQVDRADVERLAAGSVTPRGRGHRRDRVAALVDRLTGADEAGAWAIIDDALTGGMDPEQAYLDLLAAAMAEIGDRWARGDLSIAEEHQASAIVLRLIGRLGPRFARRGRKRGTIVVGAPPGDVHGLPSALLGDLLRGVRFDVIDLGGDVPVESWADTVGAADRLVAVGMGASTLDNDASIRRAIDAIRATSDVPIVLGGNAIVSADHALALGATHHSGSFAAAVDLLDALAAPARGTGAVAGEPAT